MPEPPVVLITDSEFDGEAPEREVLDPAGIRLERVQSRDQAGVGAAAARVGASGLLVQYAQVGAEVFAAAPSVGCVARYGMGVDTVDLDAAQSAGVWVTNVPDYSPEEVVVHSLSLMLATVRRVAALDRDIRAGGWHFRAGGTIPRLSGLTLGVVGLGRIGQLVARRAQPLVGAVRGCDPQVPDDAWPPEVERCTTVIELAAQADILSLHLPLSDATRNLIDAKVLAAMRPGGYLVNAARGGLVDLDAMLKALDSGQLAGAGLDVLPQEPPPEDHPVRHHPGVVLTPHGAWYSAESESEIRSRAAENLAVWLREGAPPAHRCVVRPASPRPVP